MAVFISYARKDHALVTSLAGDIQRARHEVWFDRQLTGGQSWWDTILEQVRSCELFVVVLSPDSIKSRACVSEIDYAVALGKPLLPVMVRTVAMQLAPRVVADAQVVMYTERTADAMLDLTNALASARRAGPLPADLPKPPEVPITYLGPLQVQVVADSLTFHQQSALLVELRSYVHAEDSHDVALLLLREMRQRADISESIGRDIDAILAGASVAASATTGATAAAATTAGWHRDPLGRYEQRYWDGARWTDHVTRAGQQLIDPLGLSATPTVRAAPAPVAPTTVAPTKARNEIRFTAPAATAPTAHVSTTAVGPTGRMVQGAWTAGEFIGLLFASLGTCGLAGLIVGATNLKHPQRKGQAIVLIGIFAALVVLLLIIGLSNSGSGSSNNF